MNEELQTALSELIGKVDNGVTAGSEFLMTEIPEVIQQLLAWYSLKSIAWGTLFLMPSLLILWGIYKGIKLVLDDGEDGIIPLILIGGLAFMFTIGHALGYYLAALMIWMAPKVWLIEYAAKLTD